MNSIYDYVDAVTNFNSLNSFQINILYSKNYDSLLKYIGDIIHYYDILKKVVDNEQSLDNETLLIDIGLFVNRLNEVIDRLNEK